MVLKVRCGISMKEKIIFLIIFSFMEMLLCTFVSNITYKFSALTLYTAIPFTHFFSGKTTSDTESCLGSNKPEALLKIKLCVEISDINTELKLMYYKEGTGNELQ